MSIINKIWTFVSKLCLHEKCVLLGCTVVGAVFNAVSSFQAVIGE